MSTKDNSNKKQNKGFIALLVEKARNIFDTEESKTENSKKTDNTKKATKTTSKPKSTSAKSSKAGKHSLPKNTTASKSGSKTASTTKTKNTSKKATTAKATTVKTTAAKATKTKVNAKIKAEDEEKINNTALSVEEKDKTVEKNKDNKKEIKIEKDKVKTTSKSNKDKNKEIVKEKTDSENNDNRVKILEYYDLPFRYNHTVVKVLAQTPNRLFIYWDVSDEDKQALIDKFGPYFYNNTKPVLIVHNKTMNYSFEVDINDYANSWYLHVNDSKCDYDVELGRRSINKYAQIPNGYLDISHSNSVQSPNDHILFDELGNSVVFENVKTSEKYEKDISSAKFLKRLGALLNIKGLYNHLYKGEVINSNFDLNNPTS